MAARPKILAVDDYPENLYILDRVLSRLDVEVLPATSGAVALDLTRQNDFCVAIVDVQMPGMDGYELVERLRGDPLTRTLPVIFVTAVYADEYHHRKAYESGAVDFMSKPFIPEILLSKVRVFIELFSQRLALQETVQQLAELNQQVLLLNASLEDKVRERTFELETTRSELIRQLGRAGEQRDHETGMHVERVSHYVRFLALAAGLDDSIADLYFTIAPLHDIGKIGIPDHILLKPAPLTPEERQIMQEHTRIGARIIGDHPSELLSVARIGCLTHHERWDGTGYPDRLSGKDIPLLGRLLALADVFDAVTSSRPYKAAWPLAEAFDLVWEETGKHFDPTLAALFLHHKDAVVKISQTYRDY